MRSAPASVRSACKQRLPQPVEKALQPRLPLLYGRHPGFEALKSVVDSAKSVVDPVKAFIGLLLEPVDAGVDSVEPSVDSVEPLNSLAFKPVDTSVDFPKPLGELLVQESESRKTEHPKRHAHADYGDKFWRHSVSTPLTDILPCPVALSTRKPPQQLSYRVVMNDLISPVSRLKRHRSRPRRSSPYTWISGVGRSVRLSIW